MSDQKLKESEIGLQVGTASKNDQRGRKSVFASRKRTLGQCQVENGEKTRYFQDLRRSS